MSRGSEWRACAGDTTQLREIWVNFWYRDPSEVTEPAQEMFQTGAAMGGVTFAVQPRLRFSAWRNRGSQRELFYEAYNWEEPLVLEFASTVTNASPDRDKQIEGGWSGILDFKAGDVLEWECHVVNKSDKVLRFTNNTCDGEMCIVDAELVGANCGLL